MKKLFAVLAVAAFMTACNDSATTGTGTNDDSTKQAHDADSIKNSIENTKDSAAAVINNTADSAIEKMENAKDSLKK